MRVFPCDRHSVELPPGHGFPMDKYRRLRERLQAAEFAARLAFVEPEAATDADLARVHDSDYIRRMAAGAMADAEMRRIGFPWSAALVERSRRSVGATLQAGRAALAEGFAANLAGGTHHAFRARGEGYCLFNDVAVAIRALQSEGRLRRALVVDLDVHQGNGTAALFAGDDEVFTLSLHGAGNFPVRKERGDLDVELPDGCGDAEYLERLDAALATAWPAARPELAFYLAGADPYAGDRFGRLALSKQGLVVRDAMVFDAAERQGTPVAIAMAGGYAKAIDDIVDIHAATIAEACRRWARRAALRAG